MDGGRAGLRQAAGAFDVPALAVPAFEVPPAAAAVVPEVEDDESDAAGAAAAPDDDSDDDSDEDVEGASEDGVDDVPERLSVR